MLSLLMTALAGEGVAAVAVGIALLSALAWPAVLAGAAAVACVRAVDFAQIALTRAHRRASVTTGGAHD